MSDSDVTPTLNAATLRDLAENATPGPFNADRYEVRNQDGIFADCSCPDDAALIAYLGTHAHEIADALEIVEKLKRERAQLVDTYHRAGGNNLTNYGWGGLRVCNTVLGRDTEDTNHGE